jgi:pimeloyl-ACP methyl ester carboxylesterase
VTYRASTNARVIDVRDKRMTLASGVRLHYRDWGEPAAPVVVLIHGSGLTARAYDSLARGLADRFRVIVPDLRGHGESDWAEEYTWECALDDVIELIRPLALSPVSIVGHSIGAQLAAAYAARRPTAVLRMVLVDWAPGAMFTAEYGRALAEVFGQRAIRNPETVLRTAKRTQPRLLDDEFLHVIESNLVAGEDPLLTWRFDPRALGGGLAFWMDEATTLALLAKILCPTLLIRAVESQYVTREQAVRTIGRLHNGRLASIPESGHGVPWEQPERLLQMVREFLAPRAESAP